MPNRLQVLVYTFADAARVLAPYIVNGTTQAPAPALWMRVVTMDAVKAAELRDGYNQLVAALNDARAAIQRHRAVHVRLDRGGGRLACDAGGPRRGAIADGEAEGARTGPRHKGARGPCERQRAGATAGQRALGRARRGEVPQAQRELGLPPRRGRDPAGPAAGGWGIRFIPAELRAWVTSGAADGRGR